MEKIQTERQNHITTCRLTIIISLAERSRTNIPHDALKIQWCFRSYRVDRQTDKHRTDTTENNITLTAWMVTITNNNMEYQTKQDAVITAAVTLTTLLSPVCTSSTSSAVPSISGWKWSRLAIGLQPRVCQTQQDDSISNIQHYRQTATSNDFIDSHYPDMCLGWLSSVVLRASD